MKLSPLEILLLVVGVLAYFAVLFATDRALPARAKAPFRYGAVALSVGIFFFAIQEYIPQHGRAVDITKAAIAIAAAAGIFYEQHRKGQMRPIAERWKKLAGVTLALAAIAAYFNGFHFGYPKYYHRWDQYHYYMGAKYFPELGYKNLYKCAVIAEDDLGRVRATLDRTPGAPRAPSSFLDLRAEMRDPDKKVRDLPGEFSDEYGGDNLLVPVQKILEHPEQCRDLFTEQRWEEYKRDVAFFRVVSGKKYWSDMQKDHGFNPPPVWTIAGKFFSDLAPTSVQFMQFLAALDLLYLAGMFVVLWWGFGWRVFAVGAIFWGCQASAPFYWTGGAFLRQDWLFFSVLSVACIRKRHFKIAGAALVYAGLLRVFPGLVVIGTLVPFVTHLVRRRSMHPDHKQMLIGGCIAAAVLLPLGSFMTAKKDGPFLERMVEPYKIFYEHTIETHDKTPLTNHMGWQVIVSHKFFEFQKPGLRSDEEQGAWLRTLPESQRKFFRWLAPVKLPVKLATGPSSGHMAYVKDNKLTDPFKVWKDMRNQRYAELRYFSWSVIGLTLAAFVLVVHRVKSLWIAQCLGQIWVIMLSQLTCYYYTFLILGAPLTKVRRQIELGLFALAAITQIIFMNTGDNDNKYTLLTIASLAWCWLMLGLFWRRPTDVAAQRAIEGVASDEADSARAA